MKAPRSALRTQACTDRSNACQLQQVRPKGGIGFDGQELGPDRKTELTQEVPAVGSCIHDSGRLHIEKVEANVVTEDLGVTRLFSQTIANSSRSLEEPVAKSFPRFGGGLSCRRSGYAHRTAAGRQKPTPVIRSWPKRPVAAEAIPNRSTPRVVPSGRRATNAAWAQI